MELNLSKLLRSCKEYPTHNTITFLKNWTSKKVVKSKSNSTLNKTQFIKTHTETLHPIEALSNSKQSHSRISTFEGLKIDACPKKIVIRHKSGYKSTHLKQSNLGSDEKVCHTYAIPRKLRTMKRTEIEVSELSKSVVDLKAVSKNDVNWKRNIFVVKNWSSQGILKRNDYFHESFLKSFTEKYENQESAVK